MSVMLCGGGELSGTGLLDAFTAEARAHAGGGAPRVLIVAVGEDASAWEPDYRADFDGLDVDLGYLALGDGERLTVAALQGIDGLFIAGGVTPRYRLALDDEAAGEIRRQVQAGLPYFGYSAGSMLAAERAIIGGWRIGGVEVVPKEWNEGLDEVTVEGGLGLVDIAIDVHAAQAGLLTRLIAGTEAGLIDGGIAIDESTALVASEGRLDVIGRGSVWIVTPEHDGEGEDAQGSGVRVRSVRAERAS